MISLHFTHFCFLGFSDWLSDGLNVKKNRNLTLRIQTTFFFFVCLVLKKILQFLDHISIDTILQRKANIIRNECIIIHRVFVKNIIGIFVFLFQVSIVCNRARFIVMASFLDCYKVR